MWYDKEPPNTAIQQKVFEWAANAKEERLSAFAGDAVMAIRRVHERTEEVENERLRERRDRELEDAKNRQKDANEMPIGHKLSLSLLQRAFVIPIAARGMPFQSAAIAGQLAIAQGLPQDERAELIKRYRTAGQTDLVEGLERALWLDDNKWKFVFGITLLVFLFLRSCSG